MSKFCKIIVIILLSLTIIVLVGGYLVSNHFFHETINANTHRNTILQSNQKDDWDSWSTEIEYREINIQSFDDLILHSYLIENNTGKNVWVIICHDYSGNANQMADAGKAFYSMGYSVLLLNARGHGKSEGEYYGMGWLDRLDVISWIDYINERYPDQEIILYGVGMGAVSVMSAAGEDLPANVKLVIEDSGYTSAYSQLAHQFNQKYHFSPFFLMDFTNFINSLYAKYDLKEASALKQVANASIPILFIHGENDSFTPVKMAHSLYEAAASEKELFIISGANHDTVISSDSKLYWSTISSFIQKYLDK